MARALDPDLDLVAAAVGGDRGAFDDLYRRHAAVAWRVALAVAGNPDDAADAVAEGYVKVMQALPGKSPEDVDFRAYLLRAVRNCAIDTQRRRKRLVPTDVVALDGSSSDLGPADRAAAAEDAALLAAALLALPERQRSALWLTVVEGLKPQSAAGVLGTSPNNCAQLASRGRAGLRERFLQGLVRTTGVEGPCRSVVERLGAYSAGTLAARHVGSVEAHLAGCPACRRRLDDLADAEPRLRRAMVPLPAFVAGTAASRWRSALAGGARRLPAAMEWGQRAAGVAAAALFVGGVVGLFVTGDPERRPTAAAEPGEGTAPEVQLAMPALGPGLTAGTALVEAGEPAVVVVTPPPSTELEGRAEPALPPVEVDPAPPPPPPLPDPPAPPPSADDSAPVVQVSAAVAGPLGTAGVAAGVGAGACTGVSAGSAAVGCPPEPPASQPGATATVEVGGKRLLGL